MKVLKNWRDAICVNCERRHNLLIDKGVIACSFCGEKEFVTSSGGEFNPVWVKNTRNSIRDNWKFDTEKRFKQ